MPTQSYLSSSLYRHLAILGTLITAGSASAAIIHEPNGVPDFGWALSLSGENLLIGAPGQSQAGAAYHHMGETALTLEKKDARATSENNYFGYAVSASGNNALVGDFADKAGTESIQVGAAYYYRNLDTTAGSSDQVATETLKLQATDGAANAYFGRSVSLSGDNALIGAFGDQYNSSNQYVGAAYYYKNLNNATADANAVVTETLKLTSDYSANQNSHFGMSLDLAGNDALVSAAGVEQNRGEAYYYRNLDAATPSVDGTVKETFVLRASDRQAGDIFGRIVSLGDNTALIGANGSDNGRGAAYYYRDLDQAEMGAIVNETVKLQASNGQEGDQFGFHASLSGENALVGARLAGSGNGAVYFFDNLNQATAGSPLTETVMLTASDGKVGDLFGSSVALDGTHFALGANRSGDSQTGKVYTGDTRSFTSLNSGNTELATAGLSFVSKNDWVIGATTAGNRVTLSRDNLTGIADVATITAEGKHVYIGKQAGANRNELHIDGMLTTNQVFVGAAGNTENVIFFGQNGYLGANAVHLALGNSIGLYGVLLDYDNLLDWLALQGDIDLYANGSNVTAANAEDLLRISTSGNYTLYTAVPEPSTYAAILGSVVLGVLCVRRHRLMIRQKASGAKS